MTGAQAHAAALGVAHTPAVEAADYNPYLHVLSATKRSGKTRLLETLLPTLVRRSSSEWSVGLNWTESPSGANPDGLPAGVRPTR
jgi:hypothetical protein